MKHGRSGATPSSIELRMDSGECYGVGEKVRQRTDIIDLHRVAQRFASRRAPEHVEAGRPAAAKRVTGGISPATALSPRAGPAACAGKQLARRKGEAKIWRIKAPPVLRALPPPARCTTRHAPEGILPFLFQCYPPPSNSFKTGGAGLQVAAQKVVASAPRPVSQRVLQPGRLLF
jgi:hypothetical protein